LPTTWLGQHHGVVVLRAWLEFEIHPGFTRVGCTLLILAQRLWNFVLRNGAEQTSIRSDCRTVPGIQAVTFTPSLKRDDDHASFCFRYVAFHALTHS